MEGWETFISLLSPHDHQACIMPLPPCPVPLTLPTLPCLTSPPCAIRPASSSWSLKLRALLTTLNPESHPTLNPTLRPP